LLIWTVLLERIVAQINKKFFASFFQKISSCFLRYARECMMGFASAQPILRGVVAAEGFAGVGGEAGADGGGGGGDEADEDEGERKIRDFGVGVVA